MRFKARFSQAAFPQFSRVVQCLEKVDTQCLLRLDERHVTLAVARELHVFCKFDQARVFDGSVIESKAGNVIGMVVSLPTLGAAVKSGLAADRVMVKLSKRTGAPCLTFNIAMIDGVSVTQDVPVRIATPAEVAAVVEPPLPSPDVQLSMPDARSLRTVVERMRAVDKERSGRLTLTADTQGSFVVSIATDMARIRTCYSNLTVFRPDDSTDARIASVDVEARHLTPMLYSHMLEPETSVACLLPGKAFVMYAVLRDEVASVTYYLPVRDSVAAD